MQTARRRIDEFIGGDASPRRPSPTPLDKDEIEYIVRITVEATIASLAKGLFNELRSINERLNSIEARLDSLEKAIRTGAGSHSKKRGRGSLYDSITELLLSDGYIIGSSSKSKLGISPQRLLSTVSGLDNIVVLDAGSDFIVFTRNSLDRFKRMLRETTTSDPYEAASRLGKYGDVFNILRMAGLVYYDGKQRSWRMLE